jgi:hypothetical protein
MELNIRTLQESDWSVLKSWWKWWRWPEITKETLPMNGTGGLMIYKDEIPIVAGFLYLTNSKIAWIDWIISNPEYKEKDRKQSIELLISSLEEVAKQQDYEIIFSVTRSKHLIDTHKKLGYTVDSNSSYEISKKIK